MYNLRNRQVSLSTPTANDANLVENVENVVGETNNIETKDDIVVDGPQQLSNNNSAEFYINGKLAGKNKSKYWNISNDGWIRVGTYGNFQRGRLNFTIGDIRFYNRDLSAAEVKALYEFEKAKE